MSSGTEVERPHKRVRTRSDSKPRKGSLASNAMLVAPLDVLPDGVLVFNVLTSLDPPSLCALSAVCPRLRKLVEAHDAHIWGPVVQSRWKSLPRSLTAEAVALGGSYRAYAIQKQKALATQNEGWSAPCELEIAASLRRIGSCLDTPLAGPSQVLFLLDGSGSVGDEEFAASTSFIARASSAMRECSPGVKVSVLQFSNDVRTEWEDPQGVDGAAQVPVDAAAFESTIRSMVRMNGGTNIASALTLAGKLLRKGWGEASLPQQQVVVLITDGRVDGYQAREARAVAARLADEQPGTSMFAFGVGRGVDRAELLSIIGPGACAGCKYPEATDRYLDLFTKDDAPW